MQNIPNTEPNRTEIDQEPQEPKPNMNRTGPIANTRSRNRTEPNRNHTDLIPTDITAGVSGRTYG